MKKLVLAAMLGLAATSGQASAFSLSNFLSGGHRAGQVTRVPEAPVVQVQSANDAVRIQQLEEVVRQLNGRVEEMSFQLLQMQEQMRKTQEDNEFRFQQLEKGQSGAPAAPSVAAVPAAGSKKNDEITSIIDAPAPAAPSAPATSRRSTAPGETTLGSLEVDNKGAPVGATLNQGARNSAGLPGVDSGSAPAAASDPTKTASLGNESDAYRAAYNHVLSGDYALAETEFSSYITAYPKSARAADANFWLGEAQYSQGKYNESAKTFLNAHQSYANSPKAPEMLLKLGMSLAALDNRETACATLREVNRRYPNAGKPVQAKVASEVKRLGC
ncbi:tol-pal system protein YbgF [Rhizobium straminoryzae]|uniref:Cell division coordinator CpoB n=1 Tax=Rhizobium straminoryzae TaxID=1387186 RepID=A0A549T5Y2_9HYPH|nr:tol-pal system protein YbgF [Rhizobium straminoryzae]TRL37285.1 tol-pal system protein YbgF [Rhizobium straminoryzae]